MHTLQNLPSVLLLAIAPQKSAILVNSFEFEKQIRFRSTSLTGVYHTGVIQDYIYRKILINNVYVAHYDNLNLLAIEVGG
jgi:hypothetical protein